MDEREYHRKLGWAIVRASPLFILGVLLCCTVVALPIGILLILLSARGAKKVMKRYIASVAIRATEDRPLWTIDERPPPWLID